MFFLSCLFPEAEPFVEQQLDDLEVPVYRGLVQWRPSIDISHRRVGALIEQQLDNLEVPVLRGTIQRRSSVYISR
jgi:hypothetical protein